MSMMDRIDRFTTNHVTCTWVIDKFLDRMRNIGSSKMGSPVTKLSTGAFNLYLTRRGDNNVVISFAARGFVPLFYYRIWLTNDKGQKWLPQEGPAKSFQYRIWCDYFRYEEYGLLPGGKLTVYCEIFELDLRAIRRDRRIQFKSALDSGEYSDVVVAVGDREFKAHKVILTSCSVVFEKMFKHDLEESKRNRVEITDMSAGAAEDLLKFIYTGKVEHLDRNVYELFYAADKYQIDSLKSYCEHYLERSLSPSTVPKTLQLAELHSLEDLKSKCFYYIGFHLDEFKFKDWEELTTLNPDAIYQVLVWKYAQE